MHMHIWCSAFKEQEWPLLQWLLQAAAPPRLQRVHQLLLL
jgi:hypothetical protein